MTPQIRDTGLAPAAHRIELRARLADVAWPELCPACGARACRRLRVAKVFVRRPWTPTHHTVHRGARHVIARVDVPFCDACIDRHHALAPRLSPARRAATYLQSFQLIPIAGAGYMLAMILPAVRAEPVVDAAAGGAAWAAALFAGILLLSLARLPVATRRYRVPPQTEVTLACDFSDDIGSIIEGHRRVFAVRDPRFAAELARLNADRLWIAARNRAALIRSVAAIAILVALAAAGLFAR